MTDVTERSKVDGAADGRPGAGGLSRRQMIRAAAVTGAAAWTAPVILDSLTSPAAAGSVCVKYYAKLTTAGACYPANPSCNYSVASGTKYVCCSDSVTGEDCPYPAQLPELTTLAANTNYFQVKLKEGCYFGPLPATENSTNWQVVGNYNFTTPCPRLTGSVGAVAPDGTYTDNGYFQVGGRLAWIKKTHYFSGTGTIDLSYIYLQFCCGS
jgi:hypothetical protein